MGIRPTYEQICTLVEFIASGKNSSELHLENGVRAEKSSTQPAASLAPCRKISVAVQHRLHHSSTNVSPDPVSIQ